MPDMVDVDPHPLFVLVLGFCAVLVLLGVVGHVAERAVERERLADDLRPDELAEPGRHCEATGRIRATTLLFVEYQRGQRDRLGGG
jgi:hypothetical protein